MKTGCRGSKLRIMAGLLALSAISVSTLAAGNIDDNNNKYAWAESAGWCNFSPTHGGVTVDITGDDWFLSGYAWHENIGWIRLGVGSGPYANTAADNYGVNMDADGNLSGYAWSETCGWINFNPTHSQVTINTTTGDFDGYAWGENIGWIHFKNTSPAYGVRTTAFDVPHGSLFKIF